MNHEQRRQNRQPSMELREFTEMTYHRYGKLHKDTISIIEKSFQYSI